MRLLFPLVVFGLALMANLFVYQNCGSYEVAKDSLAELEQGSTTDDSGNSDPLCSGLDCGESLRYLKLSIANDQTIRIIKEDLGFDVSGYCDAAGFQKTRISYQFRSPKKMYPMTVTNGVCDELGRFQISIPLPTDYDHCVRHELYVDFVALHPTTLQELRNPDLGPALAYVQTTLAIGDTTCGTN